MTHKIYGYILAFIISGSAFAVPLPSEEENVVVTQPLETNEPINTPPATEPDVSIDRPEFPSGQTTNDEQEVVQEAPRPAPAVISNISEKKTDVTEPAQCVPISFKAKGWTRASNSNASDYPIIVDKETLILLPDDRYGAATAAIFSSLVSPPFEVQFEFNTYDNDGGYNGSYIWHSADGISFFFLKKGARYGTPGDGGKMGQSIRGGGLAVSFPMYGSRGVRLSAAGGKALIQRNFRNAYSHGKWIPVSVTVKTDSVTVKSGDKELFTHPVNTEDYQSGDSIGFSAATGAADARHEVRKLCFRKL